MTETTEQKSSSMELTRLKAASQEYKVHKSILIDPVTEERLTGFLEWPVFRDVFLTDWKSNRRVYTAREADMIFEKIANESLSELDRTGASDVGTDESVTTTEIPPEVRGVVQEVSQAAVQAVLEAAVKAAKTAVPAPAPKRYGRGRGRPSSSVKDTSTAPKRRGRPPGSGKKATASKPAMKRVAAKKKGGNATMRAQAIVEKYKARDWPRKDIIQKLIVAGISSGYAPSVYQKFASAR